jgi:pimeloyl-ACP methyl ester carboxylesterase
MLIAYQFKMRIMMPNMLAAQDESSQIKKFEISISDSILKDLKLRLELTRFPERETVEDDSQGPQLERVKDLIEYWRDKYDWRKIEKRLNQFDHFKTDIQGLGIHFMHIRSPHENALPLLMIHGWPGSVLEFLDSVDPLVNPTKHGGRAEDAFHLVIPSLPGFGFSDKPSSTGWNRNRIGKAFHELMERVGHPEYVAQGGDWGSHIVTEMGRLQLSGLMAIHTNLPLITPMNKPEHPKPEEQVVYDQLDRFMANGAGYHMEMMTRPQTIGYALSDSPIGLLTWVYEKFASWTDSNGDPLNVLTRDQILDSVTLYWVTNTAASSGRIYYENADAHYNSIPVKIPVAVSVFPGEIWTPPKEWAEMSYPKLIHWNRTEKGGHFAALEQPAIFIEEVRAAYRLLR